MPNENPQPKQIGPLRANTKIQDCSDVKLFKSIHFEMVVTYIFFYFNRFRQSQY